MVRNDSVRSCCQEIVVFSRNRNRAEFAFSSTRIYRVSLSVSQNSITGDGGCSFWQPVQADSQPKSSGLVLGRRPLGAILHSSNEPGDLSQWLCHDDSTINIVVLIIIIIIIIIISTRKLDSKERVEFWATLSLNGRVERFCYSILGTLLLSGEHLRGLIR